MDRYSLIVVGDEMSPIRRFDVRRQSVRRAIWAAGVAVAVLVLGLVDYVRLRIDQRELDSLRAETIEQREKIASFDESLGTVSGKLTALNELERKIRIIANLPGSVAAGGADVVEVGSDDAASHLDAAAGGVPADALAPAGGGASAEAAPPASAPTKRSGDVSLLRQEAQRLGLVADGQELSLAALIDELEGKRRHLASSPAVWPAEGWLTSRFGYRVSPFTNSRQFHAGIDIAGAKGTDVIATGRAKVAFAGKRGPLGNAVILDHGYGVRTVYGHNDEVYVKRGQEVGRGERIASLGNSGRSTGPHLHYVVEVAGKARNPLDYIFD